MISIINIDNIILAFWSSTYHHIIMVVDICTKHNTKFIHNIYHHYKHQIQHPRTAGWQVMVIYNIINIKKIVNMFMIFPGRLLCTVPPTAPRRKNFPRDEWSSLEEWAQAVL